MHVVFCHSEFVCLYQCNLERFIYEIIPVCRVEHKALLLLIPVHQHHNVSDVTEICNRLLLKHEMGLGRGRYTAY